MNARKITWPVLLGLALAGCGNKPESTAPAAGGTNAGGATETAAVVDVNDSESYQAWLRASGIEVPVVAPEPTHRGATAFDNTIFPIYPRGDVRVDGLTSYRVDIDLDSFRTGGTIEFRAGKKVLWKAPSAFDPPKRTWTSSIPKDVVASLKAGDVVEWGVFDLDKKGHDVTAKFKVVAKPAVGKALAEFDSNKRNRGQSELARTLAHDQILFNHGLHSEALASYLEIVGREPSITEAWRLIVESMRRLDLKKSPLFFDAVIKMGAGTKARNPAIGGGISGGGITVGGTGGGISGGPTGAPVDAAPNGIPGQTDNDKPKLEATGTTGGATKARIGEPGYVDPAMSDPAAPGAPPAPVDGQALVRQALADAQRFAADAKKAADMLAGDLKRLQSQLSAAQARLTDANGAVDAARKAIDDYALAHPNDSDPGVAAELDQRLRLAQAAQAAAQGEVDTKSAEVIRLQKDAELARLAADQAARDAADIAKPLGEAGGPVDPNAPFDNSQLTAIASQLRTHADTVAAEAVRLTALRDAAQRALDDYSLAHPNDSDPGVMGELENRFRLAQAAADAAKVAAELAAKDAMAAELAAVNAK